LFELKYFDVFIKGRGNKMENIDYKKLKEDLMKRVGPSAIMPLILSIDNADEEELILLAEEFKFNIHDYIKDDLVNQ